MILVAIFFLAAFVILIFYYSHALAGEDQTGVRRWFWTWAAKGLGLPLFFWLFWNLGLVPAFPPLLLKMIQARVPGASLLDIFLALTSLALVVLGSYWAAVSIAWLLTGVARREDIREDFLGACLIWGLIMAPVALFIFYIGRWWAAGLAVVVWLVPITQAALPLVGIKKLGPMYSRAIASMKMGKFEDAEWEVLHQLEKKEDDFEGWMMLAELYATHFGDLASANRTIHEICDQPDATPSQISVALQKLADWQLKLGENPVAARETLEEICERLPGTHLAVMARQRINQLPASREELRSQRGPKTVHLPALNDSLQESAGPAPEIDRAQAAARANECVEKLRQNPDNVAPREELARLFAERLDKPELGIEQIELLLQIPGQPSQKTVEWLSLIAAWHLKYRRDVEKARTFLERVIHEHPTSAQAFAAQRQLKLMEVEERLRKGRTRVATK